MDRARSRGLTDRTYHLARAFLLRMFRRDQESTREVELAWNDSTPRTGRDLYFEGRLLVWESRWQEAIERLTRAIGALPEDRFIGSLARLARAAAFERTGSLERALEDLLVVEGAKPEAHVGLQFWAASLWSRLGRSARAKDVIDKALEFARAHPTEAEWWKLCNACSSLEEWQWVEVASREGLEAHPDSARLLAMRAWALERAGRHEDALELNRRLLDRYPSDLPELERRVRLLGSSADFVARLAAIDHVLTIHPHSEYVLAQRSWALLKLARLPDALAAADRAIQAHPESLRARYFRAIILKNLSRTREADEEIGFALALHPLLSEAHLQRAQTSSTARSRSTRLEPGTPWRPSEAVGSASALKKRRRLRP